ncbi:MAG: methyltransferase [Cyanobacteriota bacterium]|nr:methyltransferase [Cyanobacteriota bacterium]
MSNTEPIWPEVRPGGPRFHCVAALPAGLEQAGAAELLALGACDVRLLRRAVRCRVDLTTYYRLQLQARIPFRLLRELACFPCRNAADLHSGVKAAADWGFWLPPQRSFRVDASGSIPGLSHSHYSALTVKNALIDLQRERWGQRSSVNLETPDLSLHLHLDAGAKTGKPMASLSLDGSGNSLHRRGYRVATGRAPLKENLAAGLIALSGWDGSVPLVDPMCGSGTLLIEAVCGVLKRAPGLLRREKRFAVQNWPDFDPALWEQELQSARRLEAGSLAGGIPLAPVIGSDVDPQAISLAQANAEAAGVAEFMEWRTRDVLELVPPSQPGLVVTNPPYGVRIGERTSLRELYANLSTVLKQRCSGWQLWILSGHPELTEALRLKATRRIPISNGGIDCRWLNYQIR